MAAESCCPPGSIGAPTPSFDSEQPKGTFFTVPSPAAPKNTTTPVPCYHYVAPSSSSSSSASTKALILFHDVWGFKSRIITIADWLAEQASCHVLVIDFFRGKTYADLEKYDDNMKDWFLGVPYEPNVTRDLQACIDYMQTEKNVSEFGCMGFCWGCWAIAKTCERTAGATGDAAVIVPWKVAICANPSFKIEQWLFGGDAVQLMQSISCPVLLMPAGNDPDYTKPDSAEFQAMPNKATSKSIAFEEMSHGFTTRGDLTDPKMKRDVDAALQASLEFIQKYL